MDLILIKFMANNNRKWLFTYLATHINTIIAIITYTETILVFREIIKQKDWKVVIRTGHVQTFHFING